MLRLGRAAIFIFLKFGLQKKKTNKQLTIFKQQGNGSCQPGQPGDTLLSEAGLLGFNARATHHQPGDLVKLSSSHTSVSSLVK